MKNSLRQKIWNFFRKIVRFLGYIVQEKTLDLPSEALQRPVRLSIFSLYGGKGRFWGINGLEPYSLLLLNDGQDKEALRLINTLENLARLHSIRPLLVVAIHAGDRMQEYGTAHQADYSGRGAKAQAYSQFIAEELIPYLHQNYYITRDPQQRAFAGFSLGGLSALDIVWNHPTLFQRVGVFSGSLWWRSRPFDPRQPDAGRIMHQFLKKGPRRAGLRFWFQAGTHDETSDRNNNGIIDAIDDTLDLIAVLKNLGYTEKDITYLEVEGGTHDPKTWGKVLPDFLWWAFEQK